MLSGLGTKKCSYCRRSRHPCDPLPPALYPALNATIRAHEAWQTTLSNESDEQAQRTAEAAFDARFKQWQEVDLKMYHTNKNKFTGDTPKGRKRSAAAAFGGEESVVLEMQKMRRGIFALVEVGKEVSLASDCYAIPMLTALTDYSCLRRLACGCPARPWRRRSC